MLHAWLSATQDPVVPASSPPQLPLQHCRLLVQVVPVDWHAGNWHEPLVHAPLQQSLG
ncbi:MAG: hypothetical protein ACLP1X_20050 [Polyangiaceae bacterium]